MLKGMICVTGLFSEINVKGHIIKNRVVMPPMVCFGWTDDRGLISEKNIEHYEKRAKGGVGLIIMEAHSISKDGRLSGTQLGIWSDDHIEGIKRVVDTCHSHGAAVMVQINHAGIQTPDEVCSVHIGPSDYNSGKKYGRAATYDGIKKIQNDFINAAKRAEAAGADGIELHGAHGYLIDQFMSPIINKRQDEYGGTIENRSRFACEIIDGIKSATRSNFIIGYRMGGFEPTLNEGIQIAGILEKHGINILHVSAGISDGTNPSVPEGFPYNWIVHCGTRIKQHVSIPVIVVNDIRTPERASYLIENKMADFTAIGRCLLADPEWVNKTRDGREISYCLKCKPCRWFTDGTKCPRQAG